MAVDRPRPALTALLNGVRRPAPEDGSTRPTRGTLALQALRGETPADLDVTSHDGFHLLRADLDGATLWSWDGSELVTRELGTGNHILVNGGLADDDPLVPHFKPLLAALPDPHGSASGRERVCPNV